MMKQMALVLALGAAMLGTIGCAGEYEEEEQVEMSADALSLASLGAVGNLGSALGALEGAAGIASGGLKIGSGAAGIAGAATNFASGAAGLATGGGGLAPDILGRIGDVTKRTGALQDVAQGFAGGAALGKLPKIGDLLGYNFERLSITRELGSLVSLTKVAGKILPQDARAKTASDDDSVSARLEQARQAITKSQIGR